MARRWVVAVGLALQVGASLPAAAQAPAPEDPAASRLPDATPPTSAPPPTAPPQAPTPVQPPNPPSAPALPDATPLEAPKSSTAPAPPAETVMLHSSATVLGQSVRSQDGKANGRIVDVLVDAEGHPRAAVIDFGGFLGLGTRRVAVDWARLHFTAGSSAPATIDLTLTELQAAPEFKDTTGPVPVLAPRPPPPAETPGSTSIPPGAGSSAPPVAGAAAPAETDKAAPPAAVDAPPTPSATPQPALPPAAPAAPPAQPSASTP